MSALRLNALHRVFYRTMDPTYDDVVIWSNMELCLAVVCTCIPSLRPLFSKVFPRFFSSVGLSNYNSSGQGYMADGSRGGTGRRRGTNQSYGLEEMGMGGDKSVYGAGGNKSASNDSEEMIIGKSASEFSTTPVGYGISPPKGSSVGAVYAGSRESGDASIRDVGNPVGNAR
jgi:hypothetical protein